ncbi:putative pancreatic lipase-related protein 2 isoform X2 [Apostichopus japonicus]|uniref:Putative pancreatic lipase-related protein 2 isoform X2 n=1 Tax=Stichopus japonicus TaxID=307972 RepID=A0A2G8KU56_STIJA|nr:putative pancreatic lipase-related protein 2 isoform X2 [Apostichopus japonicus]
MAIPPLSFLQFKPHVLTSEVCFDDVGCFTDDTFCSDNSFPPWNPADINTQFYLYTQTNPSGYQQLYRQDVSSIASSNFEGYRDTKFIIHGYTDTIFNNDFQNIKDLLLQKGDYNVIMVDWANGADSLYNKARQNIRVVGKEIALLTDV